MQALKIALLCTALFAIAYASSATYGKRNTTDILLFNQAVTRPRVANDFVNQDVTFGNGNTRIITAMFVVDRFTNSSGATPYLYSGGVNYTSAYFTFKSQYNYGINSTLEIYGR